VVQLSPVLDASGNLDVFALGTDGALNELSKAASGAWSGWMGLGGGVVEISSILDPNNNVDVFAIGTDGAMDYNWATPAGSWSGWIGLGRRAV
jgi:hypothetical protein